MLVPDTDAVDAVIEKERAATDEGKRARDRRRNEQRAGDQPRPHGLSRFSYAARLSGSFALVAAMTALIAASILAVVWEDEFQSYTRENMDALAATTAVRIQEAYRDQGGFTSAVIAELANSKSGSSEIAMQVTNAEGSIIYDDSWALDPHTTVIVSLAPSKEQSSVANIVVDGDVVGTVRVWSFGSNALLTQNDLQFRSNSYKAVIIATIIAVVLAAIIGLLFAKGLVVPIKRITATAKEVEEGDLTARTGMHGNDEISQLGETFDEMADSIQRDREFERRLTTDVAHELRTPLMGIQATTEAILDGVFKPDEERLAAINSETLRLKRLVEALLNLSRLESGSTPFNETTLDLVELMAGLAMSHEALLEDAGLHLIFESDESVIVDGDADMLRQAAANLISNAVRYNRPDGTVTFGVHQRGQWAAISVADTGIGLSPEDKEKVFSRFWRAKAARDRASGGLGVGLAVVKELVDYHNGRIEVESVLGEGTTFTLLIPLHKDPEQQRGRTGKIKLPIAHGDQRGTKDRSGKLKPVKDKPAKEKPAKEKPTREKPAREKPAK